jgi:multiple sugar transport system permease protein
MSTAAATAPGGRRPKSQRVHRPRIGAHAFLIVAATVWLAPMLYTIYTSLRPFSDTADKGYFSFPGSIGFGNFETAWERADASSYFVNTMIITIPSLILILLFASCVAFVVSKLSFKFNLFMLILFMAANLLPQQVMLTPLYRLYLEIELPTWIAGESGSLYDSYIGVIAAHVAFQTGFCTFVLSNYMKTIPNTLTEAARVDGAGVVRQFFGVIMPLCRPALAALATLEFTWIYNDFLWAVVLVQSGDKQPITSALLSLRGEFFTDYNMLAAGAMMAMIPTLLVFALLQRHFISGLTLGASKG